MIEVKNLSKSFGKVEALKGISFFVKPGIIFGLLGPNGAGKTTTIRIISTIIKPSSGKVYINNLDAEKYPHLIREKLGILYENSGLYRRLTGEENILYFAGLYGINPKIAHNRMLELFKVFDVDYAKRLAAQYSKGMSQKIALIRALIANPSIIMLDEPTVGLDVTSAVKVRESLAYLKNQGKTVIVSTHLMSEVEALCDHVVIIDKGILLEEGSPVEIKNKFNASNLEQAFIKVIKNEN